jgi:DNA replication and repair protein RecF
MALRRLGVQNFRCFAALEFELDARTTLITGHNASGKTSLLEAMFFLGHGRSFRSSDPDALRAEGADGFLVHGKLEEGGRTTPLGIARQGRNLEFRLAGAPAKSLATLAEAFPVQILDAEVHRLIQDGPKYRRRYLDWGLFHVEQRFLPVWRRYQRALKQRNEALKGHPVRKLVQAWDEELISAGEALDGLRRAYLEALRPAAAATVAGVLGQSLDLGYRPGWSGEGGLRAALEAAWPRDQATGTTHPGPHRADVAIQVGATAADDRVSRGQQKLLASALILAQLRLVHDQTGRSTTLLVDDLPAELDGPNVARLLDLLRNLPGQRVITAIDPAEIPAELTSGAARFHVEQGRLSALY